MSIKILKNCAPSPVSDKGQGVRSSGCQNPPPHRTRPPRAALYSARQIGSLGAGPERPQRSAMRRPADLRRGIPCQPTQLGAPGPLLRQAAAPRASDRKMSRILALSSNPYFASPQIRTCARGGRLEGVSRLGYLSRRAVLRARGVRRLTINLARSSWRPREIAVCAGCSTALHVQHCPRTVTPARAGKVSGQRDARGVRAKHTATATMAWIA